jgi:hypothetical protein
VAAGAPRIIRWVRDADGYGVQMGRMQGARRRQTPAAAHSSSRRVVAMASPPPLAMASSGDVFCPDSGVAGGVVERRRWLRWEDPAGKPGENMFERTKIGRANFEPDAKCTWHINEPSEKRALYLNRRWHFHWGLRHCLRDSKFGASPSLHPLKYMLHDQGLHRP